MTSVTVEPFQGYPTLPSGKSDTELNMVENEASNPNPMEIMMQLKMDSLEKELKNLQQKEENMAFTQTWENNGVLETHDPIARVVAKLERPKKVERTLSYMELLRADVDSGRAYRHAHAELSKSEENYDKRMREFVRYAPSYDKNPKKVFDWCENLESHLAAYSWEKVQNVAVLY